LSINRAFCYIIVLQKALGSTLVNLVTLPKWWLWKIPQPEDLGKWIHFYYYYYNNYCTNISYYVPIFLFFPFISPVFLFLKCFQFFVFYFTLTSKLWSVCVTFHSDSPEIALVLDILYIIIIAKHWSFFFRAMPLALGSV